MSPTVAALALDYPVLINPPLRPGALWSARSDAQNRPHRVDVTVDGATGALRSRRNFNQRDWVDQVVGYGVAAHEGQLFGWANSISTFFRLRAETANASVIRSSRTCSRAPSSKWRTTVRTFPEVQPGRLGQPAQSSGLVR